MHGSDTLKPAAQQDSRPVSLMPGCRHSNIITLTYTGKERIV